MCQLLITQGSKQLIGMYIADSDFFVAYCSLNLAADRLVINISGWNSFRFGSSRHGNLSRFEDREANVL